MLWFIVLTNIATMRKFLFNKQLHFCKKTRLIQGGMLQLIVSSIYTLLIFLSRGKPRTLGSPKGTTGQVRSLDTSCHIWLVMRCLYIYLNLMGNLFFFQTYTLYVGMLSFYQYKYQLMKPNNLTYSSIGIMAFMIINALLGAFYSEGKKKKN